MFLLLHLTDKLMSLKCSLYHFIFLNLWPQQHRIKTIHFCSLIIISRCFFVYVPEFIDSDQQLLYQRRKNWRYVAFFWSFTCHRRLEWSVKGVKHHFSNNAHMVKDWHDIIDELKKFVYVRFVHEFCCTMWWWSSEWKNMFYEISGQ